MTNPEPDAVRPVSSVRGTVVRLTLTALALWYFTRVVRRIDWQQVGNALTDLPVTQILVLLAVVAMRQTLNAAPLALFVPGLGLRRAMANDLSANLVATIAPPPGDLVLRIAMFRSWEVPVAQGLGGLTLNTLTYFVARFGAPLLGLAVALAAGQSQPSFVYTALVSGAVSVSIVVGLVISTRGEAATARVAAAVATRVRRFAPKVNPEQWSRTASEFVVNVADRVAARAMPAGATQVALVLSEALLLLLSLRFAGVPASAASAVSVVIALLIAYPLTALPFAGLGALDATVLAILSLNEGPWEMTAVAGMVIFRTCWVLVPLALGGITVLWWRRTTAAHHPDQQQSRPQREQQGREQGQEQGRQPVTPDSERPDERDHRERHPEPDQEHG